MGAFGKWLNARRERAKLRKELALYWGPVDVAKDEINFYETPEVYFETLSRFPEWVVDLFATTWLVAEVNNGGFSQHFFNSTGVVTPEAIDGFERLGCAEAASVTRAAAIMLGPEFPRDREERQRCALALGPKMGDDPTQILRTDLWYEIDGAFYQALESRDFDADLLAYAKLHNPNRDAVQYITAR